MSHRVHLFFPRLMLTGSLEARARPDRRVADGRTQSIANAPSSAYYAEILSAYCWTVQFSLQNKKPVQHETHLSKLSKPILLHVDAPTPTTQNDANLKLPNIDNGTTASQYKRNNINTLKSISSFCYIRPLLLKPPKTTSLCVVPRKSSPNFSVSRFLLGFPMIHSSQSNLFGMLLNNAQAIASTRCCINEDYILLRILQLSKSMDCK
jgi:hypothetical protein